MIGHGLLRRWCERLLVAGLVVFGADLASAQVVGTRRWQLQPFCNVVTLTVAQSGAVLRVDGTDDQCGAAGTPASAIGTASSSADGSVALGLTIVAAPGAAPTHVMVRLDAATLGGTWRDSDGNAGAFVPALKPIAGGTPRPTVPPAAIEQIAVGPGLRVSGGGDNVRVELATTSTGAFDFSNPNGLVSVPIDASSRGRFLWNPAKASFRAGQAIEEWSDASTGVGSAAVGFQTTASGEGSFASGGHTIASGPFSLAFGDTTLASGLASVAFGGGSVASGEASVALGVSALADGAASFAFGPLARAQGDASVAIGHTDGFVPHNLAGGAGSAVLGIGNAALGNAAVALGQFNAARGDFSVAMGTHTLTLRGGFAFGDMSGPPTVVADENQFVVRAAGGIAFYSRSDLTTGVRLPPGAGGWLSVSDANLKEGFRDLDGNDVLAKLARMPIREWNYKAQDAAVRHIGPTAQDFHAAFGLGEDPLKIGTVDADGITLRAVQALEAQARAEHDRLAADNAALVRQNADLEKQQAQLEEGIAAIEPLQAAIAALRAKLVELAKQPR
jgi:Chaperone of endosialidase/YadA head domain repeat (2 copies)